MRGEVACRLGRRREQLRDLVRIGRRRETRQPFATHGGDGKAGDRLDDPIEFKGALGACVHISGVRVTAGLSRGTLNSSVVKRPETTPRAQ